MSDSLEKLKPSKFKRELIPFIIISVITFSSLIYFAYQESEGSIGYSPETATIRIQVSSDITNSSQQCFIKISPVSYEFIKSLMGAIQLKFKRLIKIRFQYSRKIVIYIYSFHDTF